MKKLFLYCACAALALSSCAKEELQGNNDSLPQEGKYVIEVEAAEMTKTSLVDPADTTAMTVWSEGDKLGLVVKGTNTVESATLVSGAGTTKAKFSANRNIKDYSYAIYPYSYAGQGGSTAPVISGDVFTVTLPYRQTFPVSADGTSFDATKVFGTNINTMVGKVDASGKLKMRSVCSIVEFDITTNVADNMFYASVQSDTQKLSGEATIDMSAASPQLVMGTGDKSYNYIFKRSTAEIKDVGFPLKTGVSNRVYFVIPAGTYDKMQFLCSAKNAFTVVSSTPHTFTRNVIGRMNAINSSTIFRTPSEYTDLCLDAGGNEAYANCYLVKPDAADKKYRVKMVFSDGTRVVKTTTGKVLYEKSDNLNGVWVTWESEDGLIKNLYREGKYVYFTVKGGASGNALISAATTSSDIRWATHIWVSDVKDQTLDGGATFMDRNLGACYSPASQVEALAMTREQNIRTNGCMYQFGSALPKVGITESAKTAYRDNEYVFHPHSHTQYGSHFQGSGANKTVGESVWEWSHYFYGYNGSWAKGFVNTGDDAFWKESTKTMMDPCPIGYKVPGETQFTDAFVGKSTDFGYDVSVGAIWFTSGSQFVYIPWTGARTAGNSNPPAGKPVAGTLFNHFVYDTWSTTHIYPRIHFWRLNDSLTQEDISKMNVIMYGYYWGGCNINTNQYTDITYPIYSMTTGEFDSGVEKQAPTPLKVVANHRVFVSAGLPVRCVKQ